MTDEQREQLITLVKGYMEVLEVKCLAKSGADAALLERYKKGEDINDEKLRCFGACMLQELGFVRKFDRKLTFHFRKKTEH